MATKYVIASSDEMYHFKYIKREKQANGKYKYYYDTNQLKSDVKAFVNDPTGKNAKKNYQNAQQQYINAHNNLVGPAMSNAYYSTAASKIEKITSSGNKYVPVTKEERQYTENKVNEQHAKIKLDRAKKAYDASLSGKLDKTLDAGRTMIKKASNVAKDKLGYDEKDRFYEVLSNVNKKAAYDQRTAGKATGTSEDTAKLLGMGKEYINAYNEYLKTPIGVINEPSDAMKLRINSAKQAVNRLIARTKSK